LDSKTGSDVFDLNDQYKRTSKDYKKDNTRRLKQLARQEESNKGEAVTRRAQKCLMRNDFAATIEVLETAQQHFSKAKNQERLREVTALRERTKGDLVIVESNKALRNREFDKYMTLREKASGQYRIYAEVAQKAPDTEQERLDDRRRFQVQSTKQVNLPP
jgi:hypothetical protein